MQKVTNCVLKSNNEVLFIKKPRRNWYAIPGGKMEQGETLKESVVREFWEETGLHLQGPKLAGAFTFTIFEREKMVQEWMMFTFICNSYKGDLTDYCEEGELEWVPIHEIKDLPMAEGDQQILSHLLKDDELLYGSFSYTADYELLQSRLDPPNP